MLVLQKEKMLQLTIKQEAYKNGHFFLIKIITWEHHLQLCIALFCLCLTKNPRLRSTVGGENEFPGNCQELEAVGRI